MRVVRQSAYEVQSSSLPAANPAPNTCLYDMVRVPILKESLPQKNGYDQKFLN